MITEDTATSDHAASNARAARGEKGSILILTALSMTVLLGIAALSVDASYMYDMRNKLSAAADAAAKSAAIEVHRGNTANIAKFAQHQVIAHGFALAEVSLTVRLCNAPAATCSAPFAGDANYVEAIVSRNTLTFFAKVLGFANVTPRARAVAGSSRASSCVVVLGPDPAGTKALEIGSNTSLTLHGCDLAVGGGLSIGGGSASITADSVAVSAASCSGVANCTANAPSPTDPLSSLAPPPPPTPAPTCKGSPPKVSGVLTIDASQVASYYCGMEIDNGVVTFSPGVYVIAGPITNKNGGSNVTLNGSGVMFYLAPGGSINVGTSNHVAMNLTAPTSGPYSGILFYQDRANSSAAVFSKNNGDSLTLSGALYFPAAALELKNNNGITVDCALIVAKTVAFKNNTDLGDSCSAYGGSPIFTVSMAE